MQSNRSQTKPGKRRAFRLNRLRSARHLANRPDIAASTKATATIAPAITASPDRNSRVAPSFSSVAFRERYFSTAMTQTTAPARSSAAGCNITVRSALKKNNAMGTTICLFMTFLWRRPTFKVRGLARLYEPGPLHRRVGGRRNDCEGRARHERSFRELRENDLGILS